MTRNLQQWAETPTQNLTPMDAAMQTLLELTRTLAVEPTEEVHANVSERLTYGVERLMARLEAPVPEDEKPPIALIRATRTDALQAYLDGHDALMTADGEDLLSAVEVARHHFERGRALMTLAQTQVEDLLVVCPYVDGDFN
jgi:hypothetical protein